MRRNLIIAIVFSPFLTFIGIAVYFFAPLILALLGGGNGIGAVSLAISFPNMLVINLLVFMLIFALLQWKSKKPLS